MSFAEIEAELENLSPDELRRLAMKSWTAFVEKDGSRERAHECDEDDPRLLAALDDAIAHSMATPREGYTGNEVRARLGEWTSR